MRPQNAISTPPKWSAQDDIPLSELSREELERGIRFLPSSKSSSRPKKAPRDLSQEDSLPSDA
jgi:hypothetical protein